MLTASIKNAGVGGIFEPVLSREKVRTYKPLPRAYELRIERLKLTREQILFVAFAGWDAAGRDRSAIRPLWVNRLEPPTEELGEVTDSTGSGGSGLVSFLVQQLGLVGVVF